MDTTKEPFTCLSLFTGYDGIGIGIEKALSPATLKTVAHVEIEAYAIENCVEKMEAGRMVSAPVWTDVKTFNAFRFRNKIDILTGGYPCQPFSAAGKRKGKEDPRHLWPYVRDTIQAIQPKICFFENVEGHISLGLREVLTDLVELGYRVENDCGEPTWGIFSAAEVGAPHQRKRVFILAYRDGEGPYGAEEEVKKRRKCLRERGAVRNGPQSICSEMGNSRDSKFNRLSESEERYENGETWEPGSRWPASPGEPQHGWEEPRVFGDTSKQGSQIRTPGQMGECEGAEQESKRSADGCEWQTQPILGRATNGTTRRLDPTINRIDRLRLLGNGVVPQTAEKAFRTLWGRVLNPDKRKAKPIQMEMFA